MIIGTALHLRAEPGKCIECSRCTEQCTASLEVQSMVLSGSMDDAECVLCSGCVDVCPKDAIRFSFRAGFK